MTSMNFDNKLVSVPMDPKPPDPHRQSPIVKRVEPCECHPSGKGNFACGICGVCYFVSAKQFGIASYKLQFFHDESVGQTCYGKINWFCPPCYDLVQKHKRSLLNPPKKLAKVEPTPSNNAAEFASLKNSFDTLTKFVLSKFDDLSCKFDDLKANSIENIHNNTTSDVRSPLRKQPRLAVTTYASSLGLSQSKSSAATLVSTTSSTVPSNDCLARAKMNIESEKSDVVLKSLNSNASMKSSFVAKPKGNGSMDLVFVNLSKALEAKKALEDKIEHFKSKSIFPLDMTRWNIVGLPFEVSVNEAVDSLVQCNEELCFVKSSDAGLDGCIHVSHTPDALLKVMEVRQCRDEKKFRIIILVNKKMLSFLDSTK